MARAALAPPIVKLTVPHDGEGANEKQGISEFAGERLELW
jgi:hypothetical protein